MAFAHFIISSSHIFSITFVPTLAVALTTFVVTDAASTHHFNATAAAADPPNVTGVNAYKTIHATSVPPLIQRSAVDILRPFRSTHFHAIYVS